MNELTFYDAAGADESLTLSFWQGYARLTPADRDWPTHGGRDLRPNEARRLANDLLAMFPEPEYRVVGSESTGYGWQVVAGELEHRVAEFEFEPDARAFCDMKNAEVQS